MFVASIRFYRKQLIRFDRANVGEPIRLWFSSSDAVPASLLKSKFIEAPFSSISFSGTFSWQSSARNFCTRYKGLRETKLVCIRWMLRSFDSFPCFISLLQPSGVMSCSKWSNSSEKRWNFSTFKGISESSITLKTVSTCLISSNSDLERMMTPLRRPTRTVI